MTDLSKIQLPLPPAPKDPEKVGEWMELLRAQVELQKASADLERLEVDRLQARLDRDKISLEHEQLGSLRLKAAQDEERAVIELERLRREERELASKAEHAMVYAFYKPVTNESVAEAVRVLDEWSRRSPSAPIEVQLTSPGGYVLDGLGLYDFLRSLSARGHELTVTVFGFAASMGAVLLQAGDRRRIGANSFVMIHEVSSGAFGKVAEMEEELEFLRRLQDRLVKILATRSKMSRAEVKALWRKKDVWLDAEQARRAGLVDEIVK